MTMKRAYPSPPARLLAPFELHDRIKNVLSEQCPFYDMQRLPKTLKFRARVTESRARRIGKSGEQQYVAYRIVIPIQIARELDLKHDDLVDVIITRS